MRQPAQPLSSAQPDPQVLVMLGIVQTIFLPLAGFIAASILTAWLIAPLRPYMPPFWNLMKVNTTFMVLGSALSIYLTQPRRSPRALLAARIVAIAVSCIAAATISEFVFGVDLHIDTLFVSDPFSIIGGRPSIQTSITFFIMGIVLLNIRARKGVFGFVLDALTLVLSLLMLTFFSGFLFGALRLYGLSLQTRVAPPTLLCMFLLNILVFNRRAEYGLFSILLGGGIGGRAARLAAPWALALPFTLAGFRGFLTKHTSIPEEYCLALSASVMAIFGFCLILALSSRVNRLEQSIRELSLRDELTGLYNRRGLYLLAEQSLLLARRAGAPFFVLFVDLDYLKLINDTLGHDVGSERLKQIAALLEMNFRETDVIGRLGGDEFVVAGRTDSGHLRESIAHLEQTTSTANQRESKQHYPVSFSLGYILSPADSTDNLDTLIEKADAIMYEAKRMKKRARTQSGVTSARPSVVKSH
jgi:diguanylate cyclase (GGDEF)-like protein